MGVSNYALPKLSDTQILQYFIPLRTICHEVHNFTSNKLLVVFYIGGNTEQKMKFFIKISYSKFDRIVDLAKITEEVRNGKLHFRCSQMELLQLESFNST